MNFILSAVLFLSTAAIGGTALGNDETPVTRSASREIATDISYPQEWRLYFEPESLGRQTYWQSLSYFELPSNEFIQKSIENGFLGKSTRVVPATTLYDANFFIWTKGTCSAERTAKLTSALEKRDAAKNLQISSYETPKFTLDLLRHEREVVGAVMCYNAYPIYYDDFYILNLEKNIVPFDKVSFSPIPNSYGFHGVQQTQAINRYLEALPNYDACPDALNQKRTEMNWDSETLLKVFGSDFSDLVHGYLIIKVRKIKACGDSPRGIYTISKECRYPLLNEYLDQLSFSLIEAKLLKNEQGIIERDLMFNAYEADATKRPELIRAIANQSCLN